MGWSGGKYRGKSGRPASDEDRRVFVCVPIRAGVDAPPLFFQLLAQMALCLTQELILSKLNLPRSDEQNPWATYTKKNILLNQNDISTIFG